MEREEGAPTSLEEGRLSRPDRVFLCTEELTVVNHVLNFVQIVSQSWIFTRAVMTYPTYAVAFRNSIVKLWGWLYAAGALAVEERCTTAVPTLVVIVNLNLFKGFMYNMIVNPMFIFSFTWQL